MHTVAQRHVVDEPSLAGDELRHAARRARLAQHAAAIGGLDLRVAVDGEVEPLAAKQVPIRHRAVGFARLYQPICDIERCRVHRQQRRRQRQQMPARRRRRQPDRVAGMLHGIAARRDALVGRQGRFGARNIDTVVVHIQFFRRDHGQRG